MSGVTLVGMQYSHVVRELGESRDRVLGRFSALGGKRDRWARVDREAMSEALTRSEDAIEIEGGKTAPLRAALKAARRRLELELWP